MGPSVRARAPRWCAANLGPEPRATTILSARRYAAVKSGWESEFCGEKLRRGCHEANLRSSRLDTHGLETGTGTLLSVVVPLPSCPFPL